MLGRMLPEPLPPLDFDGFAIVDILVDEGAIAKIAPHRRRRLRRCAGSRNVRAHRAAAVRRRPHPSRQGTHLAAEAEPDRRFRQRAGREHRRPLGKLDRRRRGRAHGVQPALRLCARDDGHSDPYRQRRPTDENQLAGLRRSASTLARQDRPPSIAPFHHRPYRGPLTHGRRRRDARRSWDRDSRRRHPHGAESASRARRPLRSRGAQRLGA